MNLIITGVDTDKGILFCNNNIDFYLKILKKFRNNYMSFKNDFNKAALINDKDEQYRISHSLKGVLASIGASEAMNMAQKLENLCQNNASLTEIDCCLNELAVNLDRIMEQISEI